MGSVFLFNCMYVACVVRWLSPRIYCLFLVYGVANESKQETMNQTEAFFVCRFVVFRNARGGERGQGIFLFVCLLLFVCPRVASDSL